MTEANGSGNVHGSRNAIAGFTAGEVRDIIIAQYHFHLSRNYILNKKILAVLSGGAELQQDSRLVSQIREHTVNVVISLMVKRLFAGDRSVPLLSSDDVDALSKEAYDRVLAGLSHEPLPFGVVDVRLQVYGSVESLVHNIKALELEQEDEDPYEAFAGRLQTIADLSKENDVSAIAVVTSSDLSDEYVRRTVTREEVASKLSRLVDIQLDEEFLIQRFFMKGVEVSLEGADEEERREVMEVVEAEFLPDLRRSISTAREILREWVSQECERLFGPP